MNELLYQNPSSIPSKHIIIPIERLFGSNKLGFGQSSNRAQPKNPQEIINLLSRKYKNLSKTIRSYSVNVESDDKSASEKKQEIQKKEIPTRMHVPYHKTHLIQLNEKNSSVENNFTNNNEIKPAKMGQICKTVLGKQYKNPQSEEELFNAYDIVTQANNDFLKQYYLKNQDLLKKNQVSNKYKQTHKSAFLGTSRGEIVQTKIFQPGPGDYEISRIFEGQIDEELNKQQRAASMKPEGQEQYEEAFEKAKSGTINKIKNNLQKAITKGEKEEVKGDEFQINAANIPLKRINEQYMFAKDDRDRFGQQIFPLATPNLIPGPGKYEQNQFSLGKKMQILQSQEEQKRLLKVWLHPQIEDAKKSKKPIRIKTSYSIDSQGPIHLKHY